MSTKAWHWVGDTLRDGRPIPEDGETLVHDGPVEMCRSGLHASRRVLDALNYAPGATVCRVGVAEIVDEQDDKLVCRQRTILWRVEAEDLLRDFARRCALDVIDKWDAPDVVVEWLETGDETLRVAAQSPRSAQSAWYAARSARSAWCAAQSAWHAWSAAWSAAWCAAESARYAWSAARDKQNRRLTAMISARQL